LSRGQMADRISLSNVKGDGPLFPEIRTVPLLYLDKNDDIKAQVMAFLSRIVIKG